MNERELFFLVISIIAILVAGATFMVNRWGTTNRRAYETLQKKIDVGECNAFLLDTYVSFLSLHVTITIQVYAKERALCFNTHRTLEELGEKLILTHVFGNGYRIQDVEKGIEYPEGV